MHQCPVCKKMVDSEKLGKWFNCPSCNYLLCLKANDKTNTIWLQAGIVHGNVIKEIDVKESSALADSLPAGTNTKTFSQTVPAALQTLEEIKLARGSIKRDVAAKDAEMKKLASEMSVGANHTDTIERLTNELNKIKRSKDELLAKDAVLEKQQKQLLAKKEEEQEKARQSTQPQETSIPRKRAYPFGCSLLIVAVALIFFGFQLHIEWNVNALLWLAGITLVGGVINWAGSNIDF